MSKRYALSDAWWKCIKDLLPGQAGQPGATAKDNRLFVDAVLYRYRAGTPGGRRRSAGGPFVLVLVLVLVLVGATIVGSMTRTQRSVRLEGDPCHAREIAAIAPNIAGQQGQMTHRSMSTNDKKV